MDPEERPLKKARFLWEVKGKHHLKSQKRDRVSENRNDQPSTSNCEHNSGAESTSHYSCFIDSFLRRTESMRDGSDGFLPHTDYDELLPYLVMRDEFARNHYMDKWQEKRKTLAYIDNIINLVLERYKDPKFQSDESMGIEEDAICHAIEAHGLQQQSEPRIHANHSVTHITSNVACDHDKGDFMQEAVACAIFEKGLTTYGSQL